MSAALSVVDVMKPRLEPNADISQAQRGREWAGTLENLIRTAPEQLSFKDIIFYLLSLTYNPETALLDIQAVLQSGSLGHVLADAGIKLRERSPHLINFWLLCQVIRTTMQHIAFDDLKSKKMKIKSWEDLTSYVQHTLLYEKEECFRILHLDSDNHLVEDELHSRGVVNHCPVYPVKVIKSVLDRCCPAIIMLHNHPSHSTKISEDDINLTRKLERVLNNLEIKLLDHVIICGRRWVSMRASGYVGGHP